MRIILAKYKCKFGKNKNKLRMIEKKGEGKVKVNSLKN
jgi:hypothetical protein